MRLCLDLVQLNKALILPINRGPVLNDISLTLVCVKYLMLKDASSRYHNLNLNELSSYLMTFSCLFSRYQYIRLAFGAAPPSDMFHKKIDELFNDIPNVFDIADDILTAGFDADGRDHDDRLEQVLHRCRQMNLKLNKVNVYLGEHTSHFGELIYRHGVSPDPAKVKVLIDMPPPKMKGELQ